MATLNSKCRNQKCHPCLYNAQRIFVCRKCYITYVTCAVMICLICPHSPSGAVRIVLVRTYQANHYCRLEPIMLLKLPIMLLSSAPKSSLLCSELCSEIQIMLIGTVKFNTLKLYLA